MSETVVVALCSFAATLLTGLGGYQLTAYRVEQQKFPRKSAYAKILNRLLH